MPQGRPRRRAWTHFLAAGAAAAGATLAAGGLMSSAGGRPVNASAAKAAPTKVFGRFNDGPKNLENSESGELLTLDLPAGKCVIIGKLTLIPGVFFGGRRVCSLTAGSDFDETRFSGPGPNDPPSPGGPSDVETATLTALHSSAVPFTARLGCTRRLPMNVEDMKVTALQVGELQNTPG